MKKSAISVEQKRRVLSYVVRGEMLKKDSVRPLLRKLMESDKLLERVFLVKELSDIRKDILINSYSLICTSSGNEGTPFAFLIGTEVETESPEYGLSLLNSIENKEMPIFIQFNYYERDIHASFVDAVTILSEDFYYELDQKVEKESKRNSSLVVEEIGIKLLLAYTHKKIDKSLDEKNEKDFMTYTKELLQRQEKLAFIQQELQKN